MFKAQVMSVTSPDQTSGNHVREAARGPVKEPDLEVGAGVELDPATLSCIRINQGWQFRVGGEQPGGAKSWAGLNRSIPGEPNMCAVAKVMGAPEVNEGCRARAYAQADVHSLTQVAGCQE
jgi:hypothetical protein